ncbi:MAG TPA: hypothetical protein VJ249_07830 [Candidatus Bathyarchaeia archaeon]|nr:hypothetical protein [Candidatus Bathyarchaeia archaeon]
MLRATAEDKDDVFIENLNTALFLLLGILAVAASVILLGYSAFIAVSGQQFSEGLLTTSGFASLLLVIGLGSVHLFRRRRQLRKKRADSIF